MGFEDRAEIVGLFEAVIALFEQRKDQEMIQGIRSMQAEIAKIQEDKIQDIKQTIKGKLLVLEGNSVDLPCTP